LTGQKMAGTTSRGPKVNLTTSSPAETRRLGRLIGKQAAPGDVILLQGDLGAGKTCFTQGVARGLEIKGYVMSPTFVLVREHRDGRLPLFHLDLYRLDNLAELSDLGLDEYFYGPGISIVEWAEKGRGLLPQGHLMIKIEIAPDNVRNLTIEATDDKHRRIVQHLKNRLKNAGSKIAD